MAILTGNGLTVTFSGFTGNLHVVGPIPYTLGKIETSHLGTTGFKTYCGEDLEEPPEVPFEAEFDTSAAVPARGTVATLTITYGTPSGLSTGRIVAGTAFPINIEFGEARNNEIVMLRGTWAFDGVTGPTDTVAA